MTRLPVQQLAKILRNPAINTRLHENDVARTIWLAIGEEYHKERERTATSSKPAPTYSIIPTLSAHSGGGFEPTCYP
jgi:hypothetical protein